MNNINQLLQSDNFAATISETVSEEQTNQLYAELSNLDTSKLSTQGFLTLVQQLNITSSNQQTAANDASSRKFNKHMFRLANQKLVEFSKMHQAWQVVFEVLQNSASLDDQNIFHAASILKNKTMFDFVAFRMQIDPN